LFPILDTAPLNSQIIASKHAMSKSNERIVNVFEVLRTAVSEKTEANQNSAEAANDTLTNTATAYIRRASCTTLLELGAKPNCLAIAVEYMRNNSAVTM
jgi:hypothetical protein